LWSVEVIQLTRTLPRRTTAGVLRPGLVAVAVLIAT
jgi:hypothetical protein